MEPAIAIIKTDLPLCLSCRNIEPYRSIVSSWLHRPIWRSETQGVLWRAPRTLFSLIAGQLKIFLLPGLVKESLPSQCRRLHQKRGRQGSGRAKGLVEAMAL